MQIDLEKARAVLGSLDLDDVQIRWFVRVVFDALRPGDELPGGLVVVPTAFVQTVRDYLDGNYENPRKHRPGRCGHGTWYYEPCEQCVDAHFATAIAMLAPRA